MRVHERTGITLEEETRQKCHSLVCIQTMPSKSKYCLGISGNVKYSLTASLGAGHEAGEYLRHIYFKLRSRASARAKESIIVK